MAPRAGFEIYRKYLSSLVLRASDEPNTPIDTPRRIEVPEFKQPMMRPSDTIMVRALPTERFMESHRLSWIFLVTMFTTSLAFAEDCAVTPPGANGWNENGALRTVIPPDSKFRFIPDGPGFIDHDGALGIKMGWWRNIPGSQLEITGRRVDAGAPPLRAYIPSGYPEHFQASYVVFPMPGCWEIVASIGLQSLTIVLAVEFIAPGPKSRLNGPPRGWRQTGG